MDPICSLGTLSWELLQCRPTTTRHRSRPKYRIKTGINKNIEAKIEKTNGRKAAITEDRIQLLTECITGIKTVKLASWEAPLARRIDEKRQQEREINIFAGLLLTLLNLASNNMVDGISVMICMLYVFALMLGVGRWWDWRCVPAGFIAASIPGGAWWFDRRLERGLFALDDALTPP